MASSTVLNSFFEFINKGSNVAALAFFSNDDDKFVNVKTSSRYSSFSSESVFKL